MSCISEFREVPLIKRKKEGMLSELSAALQGGSAWTPEDADFLFPN